MKLNRLREYRTRKSSKPTYAEAENTDIEEEEVITTQTNIEPPAKREYKKRTRQNTGPANKKVKKIELINHIKPIMSNTINQNSQQEALFALTSQNKNGLLHSDLTPPQIKNVINIEEAHKPAQSQSANGKKMQPSLTKQAIPETEES